jgi:hypothetical protein
MPAPVSKTTDLQLGDVMNAATRCSTDARSVVSGGGVLRVDYSTVHLTKKKLLFFSNLTDLAVTCCMLHSHGE